MFKGLFSVIQHFTEKVTDRTIFSMWQNVWQTTFYIQFIREVVTVKLYFPWGKRFTNYFLCKKSDWRINFIYISEVVERVRDWQKPPFRPTLEEFDCPCDELAVVIRRCWAEDPMERPDFAALKSIIRKLNKYVHFIIWSCTHKFIIFADNIFIVYYNYYKKDMHLSLNSLYFATSYIALTYYVWN